MECHFARGSSFFMQVVVMLVGCALGACSPWHAPAPPATTAVLDGPDGPGTVANLRHRYEDLAMDCRGEPAVRCTGVLVEAAVDGKDPWQPYAGNGVPMSWFRKDAWIKQAYQGRGGVTYYAPDDSPGLRKRPLYILCAYVFNAYTDFRKGRCEGYEDTATYPVSGPCQREGVFTAAQWREHFARRPSSIGMSWQCGFDLGMSDGPRVFALLPGLMRDSGVPEYTGSINELVAESWPPNEPATVPIESFYYDTRHGDSLATAQRLQVAMNDRGGIWRPVIAITFGATEDDATLFDYREADQARRPPDR
ncbi:hypothetical protein L2Y94_07245 [Luteibacter aegosomatis]|uniref:hypothetical protein n=1 Tax=Luteibacter aegosomatis TaxID=2911537 RepID=UPI001FF8B493|nr:hypothetical protein [Luteibacter aegosomatis]UPG87138.1 hypothetical protein L2Y94_07245 [Luteibacter aegosomatis]